jgi:prefoldin alpha subunit
MDKKNKEEEISNQEQKNQEVLMQFSLFEQKAKKIEEQIQLIERQISEFILLKQSVNDFAESKEENFLAPLGNGIFVNAKKTKEKDFYLGVGSNIIVKKNQLETDKTISNQITKLEEVKKSLFSELETISQDIQKLIESSQEKNDN